MAGSEAHAGFGGNAMRAELTGRGLAAEYMDPLLACATVNLAGLNERRREVMDEAPR
jgi:hypothetical protein